MPYDHIVRLIIACSLLTTLTALTSCEAREKSAVAETPAAPAAPTPPAPPTERPDTPRPALLLTAKKSPALTPLHVTHGGDLRVMDRIIPPTTSPVVSAYDGSSVCVAYAEDADGVKTTHVLLYDLDRPGAEPRAAQAPYNTPHSAFVDGQTCVLGGEGASVQRVDFASTPASVEQLESWPSSRTDWNLDYKAVDFFVDTGDTLIAVDDMVMPFFAFVYDWTSTGRSRSLSNTSRVVQLPDGPNQSYQEGIFTGAHVALMYRFSHRAGSGQGIQIHDPKLPLTMTEWEEKGVAIPPLLLVESVDRRRRKDTDPTRGVRLLAGDERTRLRGLASLGDTLFIGAGTRGILGVELPRELPEEPDQGPELSPELFPMGANVLDLTNARGQLFALLGSGSQREVARLSWDPAARALTVAARSSVPDGTTGFVTAFLPR